MYRENEIKCGLVSVTFRHLDWREIIRIARDCNMDCIEWGGDIHVPHGDLLRARQVAEATADAGLAVLSYGSYYTLGAGEPFEPVLGTAAALQANTIRIWAGAKGSARHSPAELKRAVAEAQGIADRAAEQGVAVAFEYHRGTLTDTAESALNLLRSVNRSNVKTYWQPNPELTHAQNLAELEAVLPYLLHAHVFHWTPDGARLPLEDGLPQWREYMSKAKIHARAALIEFVKDDDPAQFARDAEQLRRLCE